MTEKAEYERLIEGVREIVHEWSELDSDTEHYALYRRLDELTIGPAMQHSASSSGPSSRPGSTPDGG